MAIYKVGHTGFQDAAAEDDHDHARYPHTAEAHKTAFFNQHNISCDIKPRLTKEQHDVLEGHFQRAPKPNTQIKKGFADTLGVSLDKVNNWFQNRRAKSKQDAKKANGTYTVNAQQPASGFNSDPETSPAYPASDYFNMMQQYAAEEPSNMMQQYTSEESLPDGLGIFPGKKHQDQGHFGDLPYHNTSCGAEQFHDFHMPPQMSQEMFDSPQEVNRRTLTQEQFDAFTQTGTTLNGMENYGSFQNGYAGAHDIMNDLFPVSEQQQIKHQDAFVPQNYMPPPMSSLDSSVPSSISDRSMSQFPSASTAQDYSSGSASSSEWADSRSSSLHHEEPFLQMSGPSHQQAATAAQWQPGQSIPVDLNALSQEFRQAAQARQSPQQPQAHEQPLAWPADEAYIRRESSTSMLTQHMSNVGIHTPQPQQHGTFKSPAPPSSIAARRQRPRPAGLHLGAPRSQSYSGAVQPGSSGQSQQGLTPGQSLRRIRSSNVVVNGVSQGRVQKMPGSAQRSPLAWTFADAMNSPKALRHVSSQSSTNLAPPTPMSPSEFSRPQVPSWQTSGHTSRQPSISETDYEQNVTAMQPQNFSSPPHTPMYHQQSFVQQRVAQNAIAENTPPQSAPASQQCFATNAYAAPQPMKQPQLSQQAQLHSQQMQSPYAPPQQEQFMNVMVPDRHFQAPNTTYASSQQFMVPTTSAPAAAPMQFPHGFPMVNEQGVLQMMFPAQMQFAQPPAHSQPPPPPPQATHTPPQGHYGMFSTAVAAPNIQVTATPSPQPAAEFFVHEYSPPQSLKRTATPRKDNVDTGPKNYTFANQTPQHFFEKGKKSPKASATASNSPSSNTS